MASYPVSLSPEGNLLACLAQSILLCPCHEGAVRDYNALPQQEQKRVWSDLTGNEAKNRHFFRDGTEITPNAEELEPPYMVNEALECLRNELENATTTAKTTTTAYEIAIQTAPRYVKDRSFLLKFLRAEKFDVVRTVDRILLHFEIKKDLFGQEKLGREIVLSDLDVDDIASLQAGYLQVLSGVDHTNRKVLFYYKALSDCYKQRENILRVAWYIYNVISLEESVQKLGVVNVVYNNGGYPEHGMDYEKSRRLAQMFRAIPIRFDSFFVCLDEAPWLNVVEAFSFMVGKFLRVRMRALQGTHLECCYKLVAVGINSFALPVNDESELDVTSHLHWIQQRHEQESWQQQQQIIQQQEKEKQVDAAAAFYAPGHLADLVRATAPHYDNKYDQTVG